MINLSLRPKVYKQANNIEFQKAVTSINVLISSGSSLSPFTLQIMKVFLLFIFLDFAFSIPRQKNLLIETEDEVDRMFSRVHN